MARQSGKNSSPLKLVSLKSTIDNLKICPMSHIINVWLHFPKDITRLEGFLKSLVSVKFYWRKSESKW